MNVVLGTLFLILAVLLFSWAYGEFRRPDAKPWTRSNLAGNAVVLGTTAFLALGLGELLSEFGTVGKTLFAVEAALSLGALVAVCWLVVPRLVAPAQRRPAKRPAAHGYAATE